jgi:tetratricopeptide (TPR) repeat protein
MVRPLLASSICILGVLSSCTHLRSPESTAETQPAKTSETKKIADMAVSTVPESAKIFANAGYHFTMAQAYSSDGNTDRAIEEYKLALIYDPDSSTIYSRLTNEYLRKGMLSSAMEVCKEGVSKHPEFSDLRMLLGGLYATNRQYDEALKQYEYILKKEPGNEEAAVFKAQTHLELEQSALAKTSLTKFLSYDKNSALGWYYLGRVEQVNQKFTAAEDHFRKAISLKQNFLQAQLSLAFLYEETQKTEKAIEIYRAMFEQSQDLTAANRLVTIYLKKENFKAALPYLESIENLDSEDLNAQVKLGLVYMELKQLDQAEKIFKTILAKTPDSDRILFYLGNLYEETKKGDLAEATFQRIPASSKLFTDAALHVAQIRRNSGRFEEAIRYLETAIAAAPKTLPFYIYVASLHEEQTKLPSAIQSLERAFAVFPEDEKVLYYLANLYDRVGEVDKGIAKMEQLLFVNPQNADALNYLGYTWTTLGKNLDQAEALLKKALEINPKNPFVLDSWGWHLVVRGKTAKAIPFLERAVQMKGDEYIMIEHLGDAYAKLNLQEKALATYIQAATIAKEDGARLSVSKKIDSMRALLAQTGKSPKQQSRRPASVSETKIVE